MKSIIGMDILIFILSIVLIISSIILMIVISVKKDNKLIKGGKLIKKKKNIYKYIEWESERKKKIKNEFIF